MSKILNPRWWLGVVGTVAIGLLAACGGSSSEPTATPTATVEGTSAATAVATPAGTTAATASPQATVTPAATSAADAQFALGEEVFQKTAGGVGCAYCHGGDGMGDGPAMVGAPPNRGATEAMVRDALSNNPDMTFIKLSSAEIKAVVVYLAYLAEQQQ